jgi:hypothetical protein
MGLARLDVCNRHIERAEKLCHVLHLSLQLQPKQIQLLCFVAYLMSDQVTREDRIRSK